jgi:hypothetical protein
LAASGADRTFEKNTHVSNAISGSCTAAIIAAVQSSPSVKSKRAVKTPEKEFESHCQPRQNPKAAYECIAA